MTTKIMSIHGLGGHPDDRWKNDWQAAIEKVIPTDDVEFRFIAYDPIFNNVRIDPSELLETATKFLWSGIVSPFRRPRALGQIPDFLRFSAGYIAAWVEDEGFKRDTRRLILQQIAEEKPDVLLAHSLGSLLSYDALSHPEAAEPGVGTPPTT